MVGKKKRPIKIPLDIKQRGPLASKWLEFGTSKLIGQPRILKAFADVCEIIESDFRDGEQPLVVVMLSGPSGVGKTEAVKLLAEFFFKNRRARIQLDGPNYSERHTVSDLQGASKNYVGHDDDPDVTQRKLDGPGHERAICEFKEGLSEKNRKKLEGLEHEYMTLSYDIQQFFSFGEDTTNDEVAKISSKLMNLGIQMREMGFPVYDTEEGYLSILHIDEVEKGHRAFHNVLLRIFGEGILKISGGVPENRGIDNSGIVRFMNTIIVMTANSGSEKIAKILRETGGREVQLGFKSDRPLSSQDLDDEIYQIGKAALENDFSTEFLGRIDITVVARPLFRSEIEAVLEKEIDQLRLKKLFEWNFPIAVKIGPKAKAFIVDEATSRPEEGARLLRKKLKQHVINPLARLKNTNQIEEGDEILVRLGSRGGKKVLQFSLRKGKGFIFITPPS